MHRWSLDPATAVIRLSRMRDIVSIGGVTTGGGVAPGTTTSGGAPGGGYGFGVTGVGGSIDAGGRFPLGSGGGGASIGDVPPFATSVVSTSPALATRLPSSLRRFMTKNAAAITTSVAIASANNMGERRWRTTTTASSDVDCVMVAGLALPTGGVSGAATAAPRV